MNRLNINHGAITFEQPLVLTTNDGYFLSLHGEVESNDSIQEIAISIDLGIEHAVSFFKTSISKEIESHSWKTLLPISTPDPKEIFFYIRRSNSEELFNLAIPESAKDTKIYDLSTLASSPISTFPEPTYPPSEKVYPNYLDFLAEPPKPTDLSGVSICIVAIDIIGPIQNGGIGTFNFCLAEHLAKCNANVTVLWTAERYMNAQSCEYWSRYFEDINIKFIPLPHLSSTTIASFHRQRSLDTFAWLKTKAFDFVYFSEMSGIAYDSVLAKKYGDSLKNSKLCVLTHSSTKWHRHFNEEFIDERRLLEVDHMERTSVEMADLVLSPSQYLLQWCKNDRWNLPENSYVLPYPVASSLLAKKCLLKDKYVEICFFGRLETRKGLKLFCDALDHLSKDLSNIEISFLGKSMKVKNETSEQYILKRSKNWPSKCNLHTKLTHEEALEYISSGDRLIVIPSLVDNSPFTVYECLAQGVPILAAKTGGIPELFKDEGDLFEPTTEGLIKVLREKLASKPKASAPSYNQEMVQNAWVHLHTDKDLSASKLKEPPLNFEIGNTAIIKLEDLEISSIENKILSQNASAKFIAFWNLTQGYIRLPGSKLEFDCFSTFLSYLEISNINYLLLTNQGVEISAENLKILAAASNMTNSRFSVGSVEIFSKLDGTDKISYLQVPQMASPAQS